MITFLSGTDLPVFLLNVFGKFGKGDRAHLSKAAVNGLRAIQDWEQGRRSPEGAARVLLKVIDRKPEAVKRAQIAA